MTFNGIKVTYFATAESGLYKCQNLARLKKTMRFRPDRWYKIWAEYGLDDRLDSSLGTKTLVETGGNGTVGMSSGCKEVRNHISACRKQVMKRGLYGEKYSVQAEW